MPTEYNVCQIFKATDRHKSKEGDPKPSLIYQSYLGIRVGDEVMLVCPADQLASIQSDNPHWDLWTYKNILEWLEIAWSVKGLGCKHGTEPGLIPSSPSM